MKTGRQKLDCSRITLHGKLQFRGKNKKAYEATVGRYMEALERGDKFPPITLYWDEAESVIWLADGHRTLEAHKRMGQAGIVAEVIPGTFAEAREFAARANAEHGEPRDSTFQRNVAEFGVAEHPDYSLRQLADEYKISKSLAGEVRQALEGRARVRKQRAEVSAADTSDPANRELFTPKVSAADTPEAVGASAAADTPPAAAKVAKANGKAHPKADPDLEKAHAEMVRRNAELEDEVKELKDSHESMRLEIESLYRVVDADPGAARLKATLEECKRFRAFARTVEDRNNSLINEKNEAIAQATRFKRKVDQLERAAHH